MNVMQRNDSIRIATEALPEQTFAHRSLSRSSRSLRASVILSTLLAASTLAALIAAKPVPRAVPTKKGFTVNQSVAKPFQPGPVQVQKAYNKYKRPVPADVAAAAAGDGSVVNTPEQYDAEYLSPVTIGGQTLNLDFDTGSADL